MSHNLTITVFTIWFIIFSRGRSSLFRPDIKVSPPMTFIWVWFYTWIGGGEDGVARERRDGVRGKRERREKGSPRWRIESMSSLDQLTRQSTEPLVELLMGWQVGGWAGTCFVVDGWIVNKVVSRGFKGCLLSLNNFALLLKKMGHSDLCKNKSVR